MNFSEANPFKLPLNGSIPACTGSYCNRLFQEYCEESVQYGTIWQISE